LTRIIGRPANKRNLGPASLSTLQLVLNIEDGIPATDALIAATVVALGVEQLLAEDVEVCFFGGFLDDDFLVVVANLVDYPFDVLAELQLVERVDAVRVDGDTNVGC
jgi:hypothetical protein